jgi:hypothetical protein
MAYPDGYIIRKGICDDNITEVIGIQIRRNSSKRFNGSSVDALVLERTIALSPEQEEVARGKTRQSDVRHTIAIKIASSNSSGNKSRPVHVLSRELEGSITVPGEDDCTADLVIEIGCNGKIEFPIPIEIAGNNGRSYGTIDGNILMILECSVAVP